MSDLVSYVLMAVPGRLEGAARVLGQLGRECELIADPDGRGPWLNAKRAWELTPSDCEWRCLLQDDIDLGEQFADTLEQLIGQHSDLIAGRPLALYNGLTITPDLAWAMVVPPRDLPLPNTHWIERVDGVQGPAIAMARTDIAAMLAWVSANMRPDTTTKSADIRPSLWLEAEGRTSLCPVPSWVQHRGWEESAIGTKSSRSVPRVAPTFTGEPLGAIDWTLGLSPGSAARAGRELGASGRIHTHLWRMDADESDSKIRRRA